MIALRTPGVGSHLPALRSCFSDEPNAIYFANSNKGIEIACLCRNGGDRRHECGKTNNRRLVFLLGDSPEWDESSTQMPMGNAATIDCDLSTGAIRVISSIVGLPPVFVYQGSGLTVVTSALNLLAQMDMELHLRFDPRGVLDTCTVGHPIQQRTLFQNVSVIGGGCVVRMNGEGGCSDITKRWQPEATSACDDWSSYTAAQARAFRAAIGRIDLSESSLSLTGGLDTRAILVELIRRGLNIKAFTVSGSGLSLDARIARDLCRAYEIPHSIIHLDDEFLRDAPSYARRATLLSGGLGSLSYAGQVYCYERLRLQSRAVLSGYLGNQIGRGGVEKVSLRNVNARLLSKAIRSIDEDKPRDQWFAGRGSGDGRLSCGFLVQQEAPLSGIGSYCVGSSFAVQQSPYASRALIALSAQMPKRHLRQRRTSRMSLRTQDLQHRILGQPLHMSFQRQLISEAGGYASVCPINWGWRARRGVSFAGLLRGGVAALDQLAARSGLHRGGVGRLLKIAGIAGRSEHILLSKWLNEQLSEFVCDTLSGDAIRVAGVLDPRETSKLVDRHHSGRCRNHREILFALDITLAGKAFSATL